MRNKELVVSLNKLLFLKPDGPQSITISVMANDQEHFIQNDKIVRGNKVSFFRQCLFVDPEEGMELRLYEVNQKSRRLLEVFQIQIKELKMVGSRPIAFEARSSEYVLLWEGWIFKEESSTYPMSQKDYSELEMPLQQCSQPSLSNSHSQYLRLTSNHSKKRSSSTENSLHQSEELPSPRNTSAICSGDIGLRIRKPQLRSHICSKMLNGLSSILSPTKV